MNETYPRLRRSGPFGWLARGALLLLAAQIGQAGTAPFTMAEVLDYPYVGAIVASGSGDRIAWLQNLHGVQNLWLAQEPDFAAKQVTHYSDDDGQQLTQLTLEPNGRHLIYVRGGDQEANWADPQGLAPDPTASTAQPVVAVWSVDVRTGVSVKVAEGNSPAISSRGELAYLKGGQVWTAKLDGTGHAERLFFDRGHDGELVWSPDGTRLAFVSDRGDHSFIGIFTSKDRPLAFLAPSTSFDNVPRWAPDGKSIAFIRTRGKGAQPQPLYTVTPQPWAIWIGDTASGVGHAVWQSPNTPEGSLPETTGAANLHWAAGDRLVFLAELDNWPHLYSISMVGGEPTLLTPGAFMVDDVVESWDGRFLVYSANTGTTSGDDDRRHLFRVPVDRPEPHEITSGATLDTTPVLVSDSRVAFVSAGPRRPAAVELVSQAGGTRRRLSPDVLSKEFPLERLVIPKPVNFTAADGTPVQGQLFQSDGAPGAKAGIVFLHGGPFRQMLLGWHNMEVYADHYAVNQYLANHGFVVLSINYRMGVGYGRAFQHPTKGGPAGAIEYQDVLAGARVLQSTPGVDRQRIGIWGSSYGGYLTSLALARNSDLFKAGVNIYGMSDWSAFIARDLDPPYGRYEIWNREQMMRDAWLSSPVAAIEHWRSPVLLIHGDDDRNVPFQQTVDLVQRLEAQRVPYEELVIPNEVHSFALYRSRLQVDEAVAHFFQQHLGGAVR